MVYAAPDWSHASETVVRIWPRFAWSPGGFRWGLSAEHARTSALGEQPAIGHVGTDLARGFPALCAWTELVGPDFEPKQGVHVLGADIPLQPIWTGFAVNTVFYAFVVFAVFRCWRFIGGARRFRRGRCPACSYDLEFDYRHGCSECGWRRSGATVIASG